MSSFEFEPHATDQGPPHDKNFNILSPKINADGSCGNGWVCEHRWPTHVAMVDFRNVAGTEPISGWWDNGSNQIAFSRGKKAFIVFNRQYEVDLDQKLNTNLPAGTYCDIMTGKRGDDNKCTGSSVVVNADGTAHIKLPKTSPTGMIAIHVGKLSKLN